MDKRISRVGWWLLGGMLFGGSAATGLLLAKSAEHRFAPVISRTIITHAESDAQGVMLWGEFEKRRDCDFVEAVASAGTTQLELEFLDASKKRAPTRPLGHQSFGPWRVSPAQYPLQITVRHACHPLWRTSTVMLEGYKP